MKNNSRICCSEQNRFPLSIPPRKSDIRKEKRVRFEDPEAMHAHGPDLDSSVSYDATEVRESIDPKTSEYASFKKLKQDVLHNCCSYPSHKVSGQLKISKSSNHVGADIAKRKYEDFNASIHIKKTSPHNLHPFRSPRHVPTRKKEIPDCMHDCVQKLRTPSVNECLSPLKFDTYQFSSAEYVSSVVSCRHGEIFSMKRQKLQQWIAKTTSPETDELQKGYDCVALLLNRLFPESSTSDSDGPWLRQAECETKLHSSVFPNKDIQSMQNGNHVRNLMRTEEQVGLDRDASASWCDKLGECNLAKRTVGGSNVHFLDCTATDGLRNKDRMTDGYHFLDSDSHCWCNKCRYKTLSVCRADDYGKLAIYWENRAITECEREQRATDWDYFLGKGSQYWCNRPSYKTPSLWQTDDYGKSAICGARTIFECEPEDRVTDRDCFLGSGSQYWCNRPCYRTPLPSQTDDYGKLAICVANRTILECEPEDGASDRDYFLRSGSQYWCNRPSYKALSEWHTDDYGKLAICGKDRIILDCHPEVDMFWNDVSFSSWCCRSSDRIFPDWESCEGSGSLAASSVSVSKLSSGIDDFKMPHASSSYNSTVDVTSALDVPSPLYNLIRLDRSDCANDFKHPMKSSSLFVNQDGNHLRDLSAIDVSHSSFYEHNLGRNGDCNLFSPLICDSRVHTPSYRYQNRDVATQYFEEPCHTVKSDGTPKNLLPHHSHWLIENMVHERTYPAVEAFQLAHRYYPDLIMANSFGKNYISASRALLPSESSSLLEDRDQLEKSRNREVSDNLIELCSSSLLISPANRSCNPEIHRLTWIGSDGGVLCDNFGSSYM